MYHLSELTGLIRAQTFLTTPQVIAVSVHHFVLGKANTLSKPGTGSPATGRCP